MALEAVRQTSQSRSHQKIVGYIIKEALFLNPILINTETAEQKTETMLHLRPRRKADEKESVWFEIEIYALSSDKWAECFKATIGVEIQRLNHEVIAGRQKQLAQSHAVEHSAYAKATCTRPINTQMFYKYSADNGLQYGEWFQLLRDICWDGDAVATARVDVSAPFQTTSLVHPALLDAALQIVQTQRSKGLSKPVTTSVPHRVSNGWIAASGWQQLSPQSSIRYLTIARTSAGSRDDTECTITGLSENGSLLCTFQNVVLRSTSKGDTAGSPNKRFIFSVDWKPQLSMLDRYQLQQACRTEQLKDELEWGRYNLKLESVLGQVLHTTYRQLVGERLVFPDYMKQYVAWMEHYIEQNKLESKPCSTIEDATCLENQLQDLEELCPSWGYVVRVARNLRAILTGEQDPLQIAYGTGTGFAESLYVDAFDKLCDDRFSSMLGLLSHENPGLRILEVGAGTGGLTGRVLSLFHDLETRTGASTFSEYIYTDISPALFGRAADLFSNFENRIIFKTLDLELDPCRQGFQTETYDLVVAGSVLHATSNLDTAVHNIRRLLKPGGHFLNVEIVVPEKMAMHFAFGTLPGWWSNDDDLRGSNPIVDEATWDQVLQGHGFTKNHLVIKDFISNDCHLLSAMLSTAVVKEQPNPVSNLISSLLLIIDEGSELQVVLARACLESLCRTDDNYRWKIVFLNELQRDHLSEADVTISLVECNRPLLSRVRDTEYDSLKLMIRHCQRLLWVTYADIKDPEYPFYGVMQGWLRSMRSESFEKHIITLAIESSRTDDIIACVLPSITKVFEASFRRGLPEIEYVVRDGQLMSGRLAHEPSLDEMIRDLISPQLKKEPLIVHEGGRPMKLVVGSPGILDTLHFVEDAEYDSELGPEIIEIETKAWGLSFRELFVALGRLDDGALGVDCAGIVTRVGTSCKTGLRPGDRVCALSFGCMRTICRAQETTVYKIPDGLTFEAVTSLLLPGVTAYHCLINVARLRPGEKVLIHSAAGSTGQMAVSISRMLGAQIFATVGYDDKKEFLVTKFGIDPENIFYSRDTSFAEGIMRVTEGYGVDVVVNSLSGDGLQASFECMAPHGRFVEIGTYFCAATSLPPQFPVLLYAILAN